MSIKKRILISAVISSWLFLAVLNVPDAGGWPVEDESITSQKAEIWSVVKSYVASHQRPIVNELVQLLSIPNVAADRENIRKNATLLSEMLVRRGLRAELLETAGNPLVYGEWTVPGATSTLLFYCHYDGEQVDPKGWKQATPFTPVLRDGRLEDGAKEIPGLGTLDRFEADWRLYARSASDDKGPIVALCSALDALKAAGRVPTQNIRVLFDGEEEKGSPSMPAVLSRYRDKLAGDLLLVCDGPRHPTGRPTLVFGASGYLILDLTVYGPQMALHAGHFSNWAPNPAMRLARLLASMKDDDGRVLIEGFADGQKPLTPEDEALLAAVPDDPTVLMRRFGFAAPERPNVSLQQAIQQPSLNIRGLASDLVGAASRGVIPERATASIDVRLPMGLTSAMMTERIRAHIVKQGFHITTGDPDDQERATYPRLVKLEPRDLGTPFLTSPEAPAAKRLADALTRALEGDLVRIRTFGSWLQLGPLIEMMGSPAISICTVNYDNNQHGDNENLRLGHFFESIVAFVAVLTM